MTDFLAAEDRALLERHGLGTFDALWAKQLEAVDEPNTDGGGWSSVFRLELDGHGYYLKRQSNHLTHSLRHPLGEPTFAHSAGCGERPAPGGCVGGAGLRGVGAQRHRDHLAPVAHRPGDPVLQPQLPAQVDANAKIIGCAHPHNVPPALAMLNRVEKSATNRG